MNSDLLSDDTSVVGMRLFDFLDWARQAVSPMFGARDSSTFPYGIFALPPVQRTALWSPKQVIDLWDSLFRGLPIGSMFLVGRSGKRGVRGLADGDRIVTVEQAGFDLLDGQQRTRAMLLGLIGPQFTQRCVWVDLGDESKKYRIRFHLTSASQPFGYQLENGQKLSLADRREARRQFANNAIAKRLLEKSDRKGVVREAYDYELFELLHRTDGKARSPDQPRPFKGSTATYRLDIVLRAWRTDRANADQALKELRRVLELSENVAFPNDDQIRRLDEGFGRLAAAQIALIKVDPTKFEGHAAPGGAHDSLLMLFERVGAGGTPLSAEERLFSIYKHHEPSVHNLVAKIYDNVGHVLSPTKIVVSAFRIANARSHKESHDGNTVPDVVTFAKEMAAPADRPATDRRTRSLKRELDELLLPSASGGEGALVSCFDRLFELLRYGEDNTIGLPRVMLTAMSPQLVQVLLFWVLLVREQDGSETSLKAARDDVIRFVMFWRLCVQHDDKASNRCFAMLRSGAAPVSSVLPRLYQELATEDFVLKLATPDEMEVYGGHDPSRIWLSKEKRFHQTGRDPLPIYQTWWESRDRHLLWLQRAYLENQFSDYDPTSGRDDEVPYELDHICPSADWARDWRVFEGVLIKADCLTAVEQTSARWARSVLGGSIGNFRLVDARTNEGDGAAPIADKMPFVKESDSPTKDEQTNMDAMMFNSEQRRVWFDASGNGRDWNEERLIAFQQAIEDRAHWLYRRFYEGLEFQHWGMSPGAVDRPFRDVTDESTQALLEPINDEAHNS